MNKVRNGFVVGITLLLLLSVPLWAIGGEGTIPVQTLHLWARVTGQQTVGIVCHDGVLEMFDSKAPNTGIAWCLEARPIPTVPPFGTIPVIELPDAGRVFLPLVIRDG